MGENKELTDFLDRNRISPEDWEKSKLDWKILREIADDYESQLPQLRDAADVFVKTIQRIPCVHSVSWRVKDPEHLLEKIIRKCAKDEKKYLGINKASYTTVITDLIGVRALHLFKHELFFIDDVLQKIWKPVGKPVAHHRKDESEELLAQFRARGFKLQKHEKNYCSIHYIIATQPFQHKIFAEIQVRTLLEEVWSEIDHKVSYPNHPYNAEIAKQLETLNKIVNAADDLATAINILFLSLKASESNLIFTPLELLKEEIENESLPINQMLLAKQEDKAEEISSNRDFISQYIGLSKSLKLDELRQQIATANIGKNFYAGQYAGIGSVLEEVRKTAQLVPMGEMLKFSNALIRSDEMTAAVKMATKASSVLSPLLLNYAKTMGEIMKLGGVGQVMCEINKQAVLRDISGKKTDKTKD